MYCHRFRWKNLKIQLNGVFQHHAIESRVSKKFIAYCFDFVVSIYTAIGYYRTTACPRPRLSFFYSQSPSYSKCFIYSFLPCLFIVVVFLIRFNNVFRALSFPLMLKSSMLTIIHRNGSVHRTYSQYPKSQSRGQGNL